ncbi:MAG: VOC family protein [Anaerolineales bacterium]|nr:VOC family protein [Anaerolineales bacterium]
MIQNNILGVDHVALQVPSLAQGLQFFHELLGFKIKFETAFEGHKIVMLKAGKIEIEMWEGQAAGNLAAHDSDYGVHHLAVQVKDLEAVVAHMRKIGVEVLADIYEPTHGIREAIVQGPGGVRVQFVEQNIPLLVWRSIKGDFKEN